MPWSSRPDAIGGLFLFLAIATAQGDAPPLLAGRDLGRYIQAGLNGFAYSENDAESCDDLLTCAASWSSYNATLPTITTDFGSYTTYPRTTLINTTEVYGTGDVYTTREGIPVASGDFTPTLTINTVVTVVTTTSSYVTKSHPPATNTPSCKFSPADCSKLYVSYISSLGLPPNASIPEITPAPANSPPCPGYYYKPFSTCYQSTQSATEDCKLYGNSVELFYFPSRTDGAPEPTAPPTYSYAPGVTFTSPSIYLSFDYLSGLRNIPNTVQPVCVTCNQKGCNTNALGGGDATAYEGTTITGRILTMAPENVSSMVLKYNDSEASSIISTLVANLPGYGDIAPEVSLGAVLSQALTSERLRIEDIAHPPPRAYYLRPGGAPGCGDLVQHPKCKTIFEGDYRAIISLPSEASLLQDAWATCNPAIYGVYDPPIALTEAETAESITRPSGAPPAYEPSRPTAEPVTLAPPLAVPGTKLEDKLPPRTSAIRPSFPANTDNTVSPKPTSTRSEQTSSGTSSRTTSTSSTASVRPTSDSAARMQSALLRTWRWLGIVVLILYVSAF